MLTCSAVYITAPSVLPSVVVHPVIHVEDLTVLLSEELEVVRLMEELELGVSEAFRVSLPEVHTRYFRDSDIGIDLVEERNYRDEVEDHYQSSRYTTKNIDRIPFSMYNSDD
jgi:hypothetical protein